MNEAMDHVRNALLFVIAVFLGVIMIYTIKSYYQEQQYESKEIQEQQEIPQSESESTQNIPEPEPETQIKEETVAQRTNLYQFNIIKGEEEHPVSFVETIDFTGNTSIPVITEGNYCNKDKFLSTHHCQTEDDLINYFCPKCDYQLWIYSSGVITSTAELRCTKCEWTSYSVDLIDCGEEKYAAKILMKLFTDGNLNHDFKFRQKEYTGG